jgi:hypothetical protein
MVKTRHKVILIWVWQPSNDSNVLEPTTVSTFKHVKPACLLTNYLRGGKSFACQKERSVAGLKPGVEMGGKHLAAWRAEQEKHRSSRGLKADRYNKFIFQKRQWPVCTYIGWTWRRWESWFGHHATRNITPCHRTNERTNKHRNGLEGDNRPTGDRLFSSTPHRTDLS